MARRKNKQVGTGATPIANSMSFLRTMVILLVTVEQKDQKPVSQIAQRSMIRLRGFILNPIVIVITVVGILLVGWTHYTKASHDFSMPTNNLLPGSSFENLQSNGVPSGWQLIRSGSFDSNLSSSEGYVDDKALTISVSNYRQGDLELVSPKVSIHAQTTYLFKGFYTTSSDFDLLVKYTNLDGSVKLQLVHSYQPNPGLWSTVSTALRPDAKIKSVQFIYRMSTNGELQLDNTYFETSNTAYVSLPPVLGNQLLANANLAQNDTNVPLKWSSYKSGNNDVSFAYSPSSGAGSNVSVDVSKYKNGEAKWQPDAFAVTPGQYFQFNFEYMSTSPADVVAEYVLKNGSYRFNTAETVSPASEWTSVTVNFEVPNDAITMSPTIIMHSNGSLKTAQYSLYNITKQHPVRWDRPLISLTFDDGRSSQYQNGSVQMQAHGLIGTYYVNPATIDTKGYMTTAQLQNLQQYGNEIASRGYSPIDLTTVNSSRIDAELQESSSYLNQNFSDSTYDLATTDSNNDPQISAIARKYYESVRGIEGGINTRQNLDPYDLKVFYVTNKTSVATITSAINQAKAYDGWLILIYHQIGVSPTGSNADISVSSFNSQLNAVRQSKVTVKTVTGALAEVEKQQQ